MPANHIVIRFELQEPDDWDDLFVWMMLMTAGQWW